MNVTQLISAISSAKCLRKKLSSQINPNISILNSQNDSFEMSLSAKRNLQAKKILSRTKKFDIDSYNFLSKAERTVLMATSLHVQDAAKQSVKMGLAVKKHLDERFGDGNYVFVSIGTSPAGIGRVLEFMGVETKYIPISGLSFCSQNDYYKKFVPLFPKYIDFLDNQGISKEKIEASGKTYLFFDYTRSGRSLKLFQKIMREYFGIDCKNIKYKSFDYECYSASAKKIDPEKYAVDYIDFYVNKEHIAEFAGVDHLPLWELDKIERCKTFESENSKRFNFLIIDMLKRKKLLKYNPKNRNTL